MHRTVIAALAATVALACAGPAAAQSQALLDCAAGSFSANWKASYADTATRNATPESMRRELGSAVNNCAQQYGLPQSDWPDYFEYSMTRIQRDAFAARLTEANIPVQVIDDAVGFGPGRANPVLAGSISDDQINAIYGALRRAGIDVTAVAGDTWAIIGVYTQASSTMWNALARLR